MLRDEDAQSQADQQQDQQVVDLEPHASRGSGAHPPARPVPEQCRGDAQQDGRPGEQLQRGGVGQVHGADEDGGARHGEGGEHPAEPARAEQRREPGRHDHDRPAGQRRDDPDRRRADPEHAGDPGEQRGQRRLVHVAEREMVPRHHEVQLVLLEAIPAAHRELDRDEQGRDDPHGPRQAIGTRHPGPARRGLAGTAARGVRAEEPVD